MSPLSFTPRRVLFPVLLFLATAAINHVAAQPSTGAALPDFEPDEVYLQQTLSIDEVNGDEDQCLIQENCISGGGMRTILRFGTMIHNRGLGDAYLGQPPADRFNPNNPEYWNFDLCHNHWHFNHYANYELLSPDRSQVILKGHKNGFCLEDVVCHDGPQTLQYTCDNQGVRSGCADVYNASLPCQWIDITELFTMPNYTDSTPYILRVTVNEAGFFPESDVSNNEAFATVVIKDVPREVQMVSIEDFQSRTGVRVGNQASTTTTGSNAPPAAAAVSAPAPAVGPAAGPAGPAV
ncbi:hypothetical protein HK102_006369 [Quaeritorhiza haematococci]|nr:hypothetical protein HK102_006369 [Quaeritorhiza haematococci]